MSFFNHSDDPSKKIIVGIYHVVYNEAATDIVRALKEAGAEVRKIDNKMRVGGLDILLFRPCPCCHVSFERLGKLVNSRCQQRADGGMSIILFDYASHSGPSFIRGLVDCSNGPVPLVEAVREEVLRRRENANMRL